MTLMRGQLCRKPVVPRRPWPYMIAKPLGSIAAVVRLEMYFDSYIVSLFLERGGAPR